MRYVDLRRQRYETGSQEPAGPLKGGLYLLLALGFVLGVMVSFVIYAGGPDPAAALLRLTLRDVSG